MVFIIEVSHRHITFFFFFFFQAEDGIRDLTVTGVQTCALPILKAHMVSKIQPFQSNNVIGMVAGSDPKLKDEAVMFTAHYDHRSEERRVGKECRSRWSPYH